MKRNKKLAAARRKLRQFQKKYPQTRRALAAALVLIGILLLYLVVTASFPPRKIWLPDADSFKSDDMVIDSVPVKSEKLTTRYGVATRFTTTTDYLPDSPDNAPWVTMYEFHANKLLRPSSCPNIMNLETLSPLDCENVGDFHGSPVYIMQRSLPSGVTEYFTENQGVFIFIKGSGDGYKSLDYLNSFRIMNPSQVASQITANKKQVDQILAKQRAQKAATDAHNAQTYTRLDFTPVMAATIPAGWKALAADKITLDGPDADHPKLINANYINKNDRYQIIDWHVGKLSDFTLGESCGPSPGYSMENIACHTVAGTSYYEAAFYDDANDYVRYLYYPVGDSLVITHLVAYSKDNKRPTPPDALIQVQDTLTTSAAPVDATALKGSTYSRVFYY